jgi:hypothetical protein
MIKKVSKRSPKGNRKEKKVTNTVKGHAGHGQNSNPKETERKPMWERGKKRKQKRKKLILFLFLTRNFKWS